MLPLISSRAARAERNLEGYAQWNLQYGGYLVDEGRYLEALEAFDAAFDASSSQSTMARCLLQRAMVFSSYLNEPDEAVSVYEVLQRDYPSLAETASYRRGLVLFDSGRFEQAISVLEEHMARYPSGGYVYQVEVLLDLAREALERGKPPSVPGKNPLLRVLVSKNGRNKRVAAAELGGENLKVTAPDGRTCNGAGISLAAGQDSLDIGNCPGITRLGSNQPVRILSASPITVVMGDKKKTLRGELEVTAGEGGLLVLNLVDMESYLLSVVPAESAASWPLETLKAQAVAARTYAFNRRQARTKWLYDVTDDTWDQVYAGLDREDERSSRAVRESAGVLLVYESATGLQPIQTYYTANSGGFTSDPKTIFNLSDTPYLKAQPDSASLQGKMASWTRKFERTKIENILRDRSIDVGQLESIEVASKGSCGRVLRVILKGDKSTVEVKSKPLLTGGGLKLPDVLVDIRREGETFVFEGHGFGHGVGYSQWGGAIMGEQGETFAQILSFYYPGARLQRMW
jgi:stage II sporulation protein D